MLLDSHLVEKFHGSHRQKLSGCLTATCGDAGLRLCMVEGEPVAVDVGADLRTVFARTCRIYHKIDAQVLTEVQAAIASGHQARDWLVQQQYISDAEADQISQALVEDHLLRVFRGPCADIAFDPALGPDSLAYDISAVRMRIGVEALIRTLDQRLTEEQAVEQEVGGGEAVYALSEAENASGQLGEYEKMVLNFIDGRQSVEQIAELCRDSTLNLSRVVRALLAKRIIQRVLNSAARAAVKTPGPVRAVSSAAAPAAPSAPAAATAATEFVPVRYQRETGGIRGRGLILAGLLALLAICIGVVLLVVQYNRKQERLRQEEAELNGHLSSRAWPQAIETVGRLRTAAGNDLGALRRVDGLQQQVEAAIARERTAILSLIETVEFDAARPRIARLSEDGGLRSRLAEAEQRFRAAYDEVTREVRSRLSAGDIAGALAFVDAASPRTGAGGLDELERWRVTTIDGARSADQAIPRRLALLARVRQARPSEPQSAQIAELEAELQALVRVVQEQLEVFNTQAAAGAHIEVAAELARLKLADAAAGTDLAPRAAQVLDTCKRVAGIVAQAIDPAYAAIARGEVGDALLDRRTALDRQLGSFTALSERAAIQRLSACLAACASSGARTVAGRATEAQELAKAQPADDQRLQNALAERVRLFNAVEAEAALALDEARRLGRIGDWVGAVQAMELMLAKPAWQLTEIRRTAESELEDARSRSARRVQLQAELRASLMQGDVEASNTIAREIGLAYLPLAVISQPPGAEVLRAGAVVGTTPLVLDVTADERVEMELVVRLPGYEPLTVKGVQAEAGWKLAVRLDRQATLSLDIGHSLTAKPAVVAGQLWLADRGHVVRVAGSTPTSMDITAAATLGEPVFAPVAADAEGLLLPTREGLAVRIGAAGLSRMALPVGSDHPLAGYVSPIVIDRELRIVAGIDGCLHAADARGGAVLWRSPPGAAWAAPMLLREDQLVVVRRDGRCERIHAEDGEVEASQDLGRGVREAWLADGSLGGLTDTEAFTWDGHTLVRDPLPEPCLGGGPGIVVTASGRIMVRQSEAWVEVGRLGERPAPGQTVQAMLWNGVPVVAVGPLVRVLGDQPFQFRAKADVLPLVVWDGRLVVVSMAGEVRGFPPLAGAARPGK